MSGHHPPLTCDQFKAILSKLGFTRRPMKSGTAHEDWVKTDQNGKFYKVTVDCPKAPFSQDLISSMANQAGVTKKTIYDIHFGRTSTENTTINTNAPKKFEARKQEGAEADEFWCVWDTKINALAISGAWTYLSQADAIAKAEELRSSIL